ncbi:ribonuclease inhibitor-like [Silurus meridionalis]|nr:ribonuclease inhibitor-like [Silurus meridionalis]
MKSDASMFRPWEFSTGFSSPGHRHDPESTAADEFQKKFKFNLMQKFQCLNGLMLKQENRTLLNESYTELYITEGDSGDVNKEHEQLEKQNLIFYEEDLRECGIDVTEAAVYSGVCTQIFREEFGLHQSKVYCFVHLSIQEHLAALYVHLTFMKKRRNVPQQNHVCRTLSDVHRSAVDQALDSQTGHLDLFLRFLLGISLESNQKLLHAFITQTGSSSQNKEKTVQYIKKKISEDFSAEKSINLFHCLNELGDDSLVEEIQMYLKSGTQSELSPSQWSALVFVLLTSAQDLEEFDLNKYITPDKIKDGILVRVMPVIAASRKAIIRCSKITGRSGEALTSVLNSETFSLRELHLTVNTLNLSAYKLEDSGVKRLSALLENPECKVKDLRLAYCGVSDEGCSALASALRSNPSHLRELYLSGNKVGDLGVKFLSAVLENPHCKLEILRLDDCGVSDEGCAALASALRSNPSHLRELNLTVNKVGDSGVKCLSAVLENPHCKLEILSDVSVMVHDVSVMVSDVSMMVSDVSVMVSGVNGKVREESEKTSKGSEEGDQVEAVGAKGAQACEVKEAQTKQMWSYKTSCLRLSRKTPVFPSAGGRKQLNLLEPFPLQLQLGPLLKAP